MEWKTMIGPAQFLVVNNGEIIECVTHADLMAQKGFYYNLYMSRFRGTLATVTGLTTEPGDVSSAAGG